MARRQGYSEAQIRDLANFEQRGDLSATEKVALRLAERVTRDAHTVEDQLWEEVRRHFDEGEVVELLSVIGLFNYFNRFTDALQMEPTK